MKVVLKVLKLLKKASNDVPIGKIVLGRHESFFEPKKIFAELEKTAEKLLKCCDGIGLSGFGEIEDEIAAIITETCR